MREIHTTKEEVSDPAPEGAATFLVWLVPLCSLMRSTIAFYRQCHHSQREKYWSILHQQLEDSFIHSLLYYYGSLSIDDRKHSFLPSFHSLWLAGWLLLGTLHSCGGFYDFSTSRSLFTHTRRLSCTIVLLVSSFLAVRFVVLCGSL